MKVTIHCGFPKTGTTALQKFLATNQTSLHHQGICYPVQFRDIEGIAHHELVRSATRGSNFLAETIASQAVSTNCQKYVFSAEGLSNILGREDNSGFDFFSSFCQQMTDRSCEVELLFTMRRMDKYLRSIIIQNILYDRLDLRPSDFAAHTLSALARAYAALADLVNSVNVKLFRHSSQVNNEIIEYILGGLPVHAETSFLPISVEHTSPSNYLIRFFLWLNRHVEYIPPDLHSYISFNPDSQLLLSQLELRLSHHIAEKNAFELNWEPTPELIDSSLRFYNMAWTKALSYKSRNSAFAQAQSNIMLRKYFANDLLYLITPDLIDLDFSHYLVSDKCLEPLYSEALRKIIENGSVIYDQDFASQIIYRAPDHATS